MKIDSSIDSIKTFWKRTHLDKLNGLFLFLILYIIAHILWHFFYNRLNIEMRYSDFYDHIENIECWVVSGILNSLFAIQTTLANDVIYLPNNRAIQMLPDCTGVKHGIEIVFILLIYPGPGKHKFWYIPVSVFIIFIAAIVHFLILALVLEFKPAFFEFSHSHFSRWIFFIFFFLIWVIWEEKIRFKSKVKDTPKT